MASLAFLVLCLTGGGIFAPLLTNARTRPLRTAMVAVLAVHHAERAASIGRWIGARVLASLPSRRRCRACLECSSRLSWPPGSGGRSMLGRCSCEVEG